MKRFLLLFALIAAPLFAQEAEKARAALEAIVRKDQVVSVNVPRIRVSPDLPYAQHPTPDQLKMRAERLAKDWPEFLRRFTESAATEGRALKAGVYWKEFFTGSSSDDVMRGADRWTASLIQALKTQRPIVEMETDAAIRSRMLGRIDRVTKDLNDWRLNGPESRRARSNLGGSLPDLIAPL